MSIGLLWFSSCVYSETCVMQAEDADADDRASKSKAGRKSSSAGTKEKKPRKFVITYCYDYGRKDV